MAPGSNEPYLAQNDGFFVQTTIGEASSARTLLAFYQFNGSLFTGLYVVLLGDKPIAEGEITRWSSTAALLLERLKQSNQFALFLLITRRTLWIDRGYFLNCLALYALDCGRLVLTIGSGSP